MPIWLHRVDGLNNLPKIGIQAEKSGNKVIMSFRGVNKEIANTPEAIHNAIMSFGQMDELKGSYEFNAERG